MIIELTIVLMLLLLGTGLIVLSKPLAKFVYDINMELRRELTGKREEKSPQNSWWRTDWYVLSLRYPAFGVWIFRIIGIATIVGAVFMICGIIFR